MFDTLCFLWLHHDSPPYLLYLLEKLVDGLSNDRMRTPRSTTTTTTTTTIVSKSRPDGVYPCRSFTYPDILIFPVFLCWRLGNGFNLQKKLISLQNIFYTLYMGIKCLPLLLLRPEEGICVPFENHQAEGNFTI